MCGSKPQSAGESPKRDSTETRRRVKWTVETQKETGRCFSAPLSSGSDQEGRVERVQLGRRMRPSLKIQARDFRVRHCVRRSKNVGRNHDGRMERHMRNGQDVRRLRGNHPFAAIVTLHRRIAGHGAAALHTLLVLRHCGHAVRKLQAQQRYNGHDDEYLCPHYPDSTLKWLDA